MRRKLTGRGRSLATWIALTMVLASCGLPSQASGAGEFGDLQADNETTLPVTLVINHVAVATIAPGTVGFVPKASLPSMPWHVEARSPSGRILVTFNAEAVDISRTFEANGGAMSGVGDRADLSCGRLDVWVGPPMAGPAPGPGLAGDCAP